jgi:RNA polymerase sigma-70 factor (ECF subfamily)
VNANEAATPPERSDRTLLRLVVGGNDSAAEQLYVRYVTRLKRLASAKLSPAVAQRIDAEDIVQSVFRRFFTAAGKANYDLPSGESLWSLLMVIALNRIRVLEEFHRAARRDVRRTVNDPPGDALPSIAEHEQPNAILTRLVISEAVERLPEHYQAVLTLRLEGYEVAEIATKTNRSNRTVERMLQDARQQLRSWLLEEPELNASDDDFTLADH